MKCLVRTDQPLEIVITEVMAACREMGLGVEISVKTPGRDTEAVTADGVRAAYRRFLQEVRRLGWQSLWIGTGLWLEAAACTERFVVDFAEALEQRRPQLESVSPTRRDSRIVSGTWERLIRVVRRCEPGARAWRRLATRIDEALIERGGLTGRRDISLRPGHNQSGSGSGKAVPCEHFGSSG